MRKAPSTTPTMLGDTSMRRFVRHFLEMVVAMVAGMMILLFGPFWVGALSGDALLVAGHVLMLPAMVVAMLHRRDEYTRDHRHHTRSQGRRRRPQL